MSALSILFAVFIFGLAVTEISGKSLQCKQGWLPYDDGSEVVCYLFGDTKFAKHSEAKAYCDKKHSKLAFILSKEENDFIVKHRPSMMDSEHWIGYVHEGNKEMWNNKYNEFKTGQYTNFQGINTCAFDCNRAIMDTNNGNWKKVKVDLGIITKYKALCKQTQHDSSFAPETRPLSVLVITLSALISRALL